MGVHLIERGTPTKPWEPARTIYEPGLVCNYTFQPGIENKLIDHSGYGNHGTTISGPTWQTRERGRCMNFDGTNDIVQASRTSSLTISGDELTLSAWIDPETPSSYSWIVGCSFSSNSNPFQDWALFYGKGGGGRWRYISFAITTSGTRTFIEHDTGIGIDSTGWHHVAGVYNGTDMRIYLDGQLSNTPTAKTGNLDNSGTNLTVGLDIYNNNDFPGYIDDVRVYNRALSAHEMKSLYDDTRDFAGRWLKQKRFVGIEGAAAGAAVSYLPLLGVG